ncbi:TetR/AcrR family transcriptional regulator [Streptosporangium pseudovulgare]|uniref:TetR family transcriptional regulator n=1 Tax=Streptosporangium pseudovulgare TaxID=35765 RepID=A0ABQ2QTR3_9ACTN|nr:TetR/AcrR family transcriptional regulator [Streptosporangium pseudovulgare]GGP94082.1 TetR family transcriptional regulator [Streptosporangium pseudovulgare]
MARLTRAQQQERTRAAVLAAAGREFAEHGYAGAKVDRIAERAEMTRGAVYSNFPTKRALYLAVLADLVERSADEAGQTDGTDVITGTAGTAGAAGQAPRPSPGSVAGALGSFARAWLERLPLTGDSPADGHLRLRSLTGVLDDEPARTALAQTARLEALLLALALESYPPPSVRRVRLAELVLTLLNGSAGLAETAPGFGDPFDVVRACDHLAGIDLADAWDPPHLPYVSPARPCDDPWAPPAGMSDRITGRRIDLGDDGVIAVLGAGRLAAAEEAVRGALPGDRVTVVVVTGDPAEIGRLVRLRVDDLTACLRRVFAPGAWPPLRLVLDDRALVATALGLPGVGDATETAVRVRDGRIVARADGRGAAHAAAAAGAPDATRHGGPGA